MNCQSDSGTGTSVQASGLYFSETQQIVTELSGTASEDKLLVIIKIVKNIRKSHDTIRTLEFADRFSKYFSFSHMFWSCRYHSVLKYLMEVFLSVHWNCVSFNSGIIQNQTRKFHSLNDDTFDDHSSKWPIVKYTCLQNLIFRPSANCFLHNGSW